MRAGQTDHLCLLRVFRRCCGTSHGDHIEDPISNLEGCGAQARLAQN